MSQAIRINTTLTTLDAIAPNRQRFDVINNPAPTPAESPTIAAINRAAMQLAAKGPLFPDHPCEALIASEQQRTSERRHPPRDMPRCEWYGQHRWDGRQCCLDCGHHQKAGR